MVWPARCDAWRMTAANNGPETSASTSAFEPTAVITICPQHIRDVPGAVVPGARLKWPALAGSRRASFVTLNVGAAVRSQSQSTGVRDSPYVHSAICLK